MFMEFTFLNEDVVEDDTFFTSLLERGSSKESSKTASTILKLSLENALSKASNSKRKRFYIRHSCQVHQNVEEGIYYL